MKKLFTAVVALVICLSLTLTSFAAVTIGGTFTDGTDVYVYGSYEGEADEVGVKVGERTYPLSEKKMFQANKFGKFVIGLRDAMNILGLEFDVAPYTVSGENEVIGEAVKAEKEVMDSITAVTVNGKMVSEFYQGTTETEFYYGLSELPEEASGLPPVAVKAGAHEFELKYEIEIGGWAVSAYHEGAKLVTVHFRKFAEFTTTALPKIHYQARHHYIDTSMSADIVGDLSTTFYFRTVGESIYDDAESALGYTYYNVEAVEGYAPVAYNISRVYVNEIAECTEGVSVWNYDGDLSNETFTSIADIKAANNATPKQSYHNPAMYFKGFNPIEEYKVALVSTQKQILASFDSTTVKEGANFIIMKNETDNNKFASFHLNTGTYPWKMTVKYVEKNPSLEKAISEISVGGKMVSGFVPGELKADYYYGLDTLPESAEELPEVVVKAGVLNLETVAEAEFGGYVVSAYYNGEKLTTVHFREFAEETVTISPTSVYCISSSGFNSSYSFDGDISKKDTYPANGASRIVYWGYDIPVKKDYAPVAYSMTGVRVAKYSKTPSSSVMLMYNGDGTQKETKTVAEIKADSTWVNSFANYKGFTASDAYKVAEFTAPSINSPSSTTVHEGRHYIIFRTAEDSATGHLYYQNGSSSYGFMMTVKYVEKNPSIEKAISEISVGGKMVSGFVPGELKADYYYGLDALPETVEALPAVAVKAGGFEFETVVESEYKGYAVTAYNNGEKLTTVHFREFAEETVTIAPASVYSTTGTSFVSGESFDGTTTDKPSAFPRGGTNPTVAYWGYDIPEKTGYAPVAYVLNGVRVSANTHSNYSSGVLVYNGDGTQKETKTIAEIKADSTWVNSFANYKGFTQSELYKVAELKRGSINNNVASGTLHEGRTYIIYRTIEDTSTISQLYYDKSNKNYYFKMTVKYVEKNPVDPRPADATLSSIKINGEEIEGFSSDVTTYYYPVESLESIPEDITAAATYEELGATAEVVEYDDATGTLYITGTSANGAETKNYMIKFREIQTKEVPLSSASRFQRGWSDLNSTEDEYKMTSNVAICKGSSSDNTSMVTYLLYKPELPENAVITDGVLNAKVMNTTDSAFEATVELYNFAETTSTTVDGWIDATTSTFNGHKDYFPGFRDDVTDYMHGENTLEVLSKTYSDCKISLNPARFTISANGYSILIAKKKYVEDDANNTTNIYMEKAPSITLKYYVKD